MSLQYKEETYRSPPNKLNMSDNMVRVTITCTINEWKQVKRKISEFGVLYREDQDEAR